MVEVIWPLSVPSCRGEAGNGVLPLRTFIQETLRRSRTSFSTLQVALYYLILIKAHVPKFDFTMEQPVDTTWSRALQCGRRMFLAALILASKYLQDRNYSARAWSKISGLTVCEINTNEMAFLHAVNWKLHVPEPLFERWQDILIRYTNQQPPTPGSLPSVHTWRSVIPRLTPDLETFGGAFRKPFKLQGPRVVRSVPGPISLSELSSAPETVLSPISVGPPRVLEPTPTMLPPTPSLVRMGPLPTPTLTPQSAVSSTPAASFAGFGFRRPSCSAMARVQREVICRDTADCRWPTTARFTPPETMQFPTRRPSVLSDSSSLSSPESMVSDSSSQASRTSSVSSASSVSAFPCAPLPVKLARLATLRNAGQTYALPPQQPSVLQMPSKDFGSVTIEPLSAGAISSPDFESFHISDSETPQPFQVKEEEDNTPSCTSSRGDENKNSRKRGRPSSIDLTLQQNVRNLLNAANYTSSMVESPMSVAPDERPATSFLLFDVSNGQMRTPSLTTRGGNSTVLAPKALQSPPAGARSSLLERRMPVQTCCGRKRACCARELDEAVSLPSLYRQQSRSEAVWIP
jgi:hypothetical protein